MFVIFVILGSPTTQRPDLTDRLTDEAEKFIESSKDQPFFLYLSFSAVHLPLEAKDESIEPYKDIKDLNTRLYAALTSSLDDNVGLVLEALEVNGLYDDTLIFFLSDNGGFPRR